MPYYGHLIKKTNLICIVLEHLRHLLNHGIFVVSNVQSKINSIYLTL